MFEGTTGDTTVPVNPMSIASQHWDWLYPLIRCIPYENRDDELLRYIYVTAFEHGAKHERERLESIDEMRRKEELWRRE